MNRGIYLFLLLSPFIICGAFFKNYATEIFPYLPFYVAILTIIRQRYIKMTWKEILQSPLTFSFKEKKKIFTEK